MIRQGFRAVLDTVLHDIVLKINIFSVNILF